MFNKNGNNGHGNGTGNGLVQVNGNGHKPDAAIVSEHELLWDGLSPAVSQALGQPLNPALASQRKGRGGRSFDYLEGHLVIEQANRIFGYGGWGYELAGDVTLRQVETVDTQTGEVKVSLGYSAPVRVTVAGALPRTDIGVHPVAEDTLDGHDTAMKGAVTDGMKRAFRSFGVQFGNGFYGDQPQAGNPPPPQRVSCSRQRQLRPGQGIAHPARPRAGAAASPRSKSCGSGSSRSPPSRASTRTRCGRPSWTGRARASTTWTAPSSGRSWRPPPTSSGRCSRPRPPSLPVNRVRNRERGRLLRGAAPLLHYRTRRQRAMTTTETLVSTPWGWTHDVEELAEGVWRVWTPSHGGLKLSRKRWAEIPACVRSAMFTPTFAEEDCEEPIVRTLLGLGDDNEREMALKVAGYFDRYAPALPHLRDCPPGIHYHAIAFSGGLCTDPFGRFDTRIEAESFTGDAEMVRAYGRMEAIECTGTRPLCLGKAGRP